MSIIRWEPFGWRNQGLNVNDLQHRMNDLFSNFFEGDEEPANRVWAPRVEAVELEDKYEVSVELPGMKKEDIRVELTDNVLNISGEKKTEHEKKDRTLHMCERVYGKFSRSFQLPSKVDGGKIEAEFRNGVLKLALPKAEKAKPKQIEVKVA